MPPRKNKKLTVVQEQEVVPDATDDAPDVIADEASNRTEPIEAAEQTIEQPIVNAQDTPQVAESPRADGEEEISPALQVSNDSPLDDDTPQHSTVDDNASPIYLATAEGDDGGDTREGSAGNPNFTNADTDTLPLAVTNTFATLSHSGEEVLGGDDVPVAEEHDAPNGIVEVNTNFDGVAPAADDVDLTTPSLHADSTRYVSESYELGLSGDGAAIDTQGERDEVAQLGHGPVEGGEEYVTHNPSDVAGVVEEVAGDHEAVPVEETVSPADVSLSTGADTLAAIAAVADELKVNLSSLKHYVDTRLDLCHVSILDAEDQIKLLSTETIPAGIQRSEQVMRELLHTKTSTLQTALRLSSEELSAACQQAVAEAYDSLAGAVRDATARVEDGYRQAVSRVETEHSFLIRQLSDRVAAFDDHATAAFADVNSGLSNVKNSVEQLEQRLALAMQMEIIPPAGPLPTEGTKMRLVITVECPGSTSASKTVLVPVTDAATVGMLKREVLRRAVQQSIVPAQMQTLFVFSKTVVILDGITLFEEDTLADVGIAGNDKLVIQSSDPQLLSALDSNKHSPPPPLMSSIAFDTTVSALSVSAAGVELLSPVQQSPTLASASATAPAPIPKERVVEVVAIFLDAETAAKLSEQESLERRLNTELARMELEPLKREEESKRITILKAAADKVRITLLDRATYSHVDYERRVARGALEKINESIGTGATSAGIIAATLSAKTVLAGLSTNLGEDDRVSAMEAAAKTERGRKERLMEDLKDLIFTVRHRMRIPPEFYGAAEHLLFAADRAILLAPTSTVKDIDDVHKEFSEFVDKIRPK